MADTDRLLALVADMKHQIEQADKDGQPADVTKKQEIEKLAKSVKERMRVESEGSMHTEKESVDCGRKLGCHMRSLRVVQVGVVVLAGVFGLSGGTKFGQQTPDPARGAGAARLWQLRRKRRRTISAWLRSR